MKTNRIIERIKKCLALAKSANANEAGTALRQAQALMERHGITQEHIELSDVKMETRNAGRAKTVPMYLHYLIVMISNVFGVDPLYQTDYYPIGKRINFIGIGARPQIAAYAYEVLFRQLNKDRANYLKSLKRYKRANKTRKADLFAEAWVDAAYRHAVKITIPDDDQALIQRFKADRFGQLVTVPTRSHQTKAGDVSAIVAGHSAGQNANLNHGVDGSNGPALLGKQA